MPLKPRLIPMFCCRAVLVSVKVILSAGTDVSKLLVKVNSTEVAIKVNVAEEMDVMMLLAKDRAATVTDELGFRLKFPLTELISLELKSKPMPPGAVNKLNVSSPLTDVIKLKAKFK